MFHYFEIKTLWNLIYLSVIIVVLALMIIIYEFYSWLLLLKELVCLTLNMALFVQLIINGYLALAFVYIIQYNLHLKMRNINQNIANLLKNNKINSIESIKSALLQHNRICEQISHINKILKKLYFTFVFVMNPINLLLLHQYLFEDLKFYIKIIALIIIIVESIAIFFFQFYFACLRQCINPDKTYWNFNGK